MMEVRSPALQKTRRSDKMFSPEASGLSSPINTGLSLGVRGSDIKNTTTLPPSTGCMPAVTSMRTPLPNATSGGYGSMPPAEAAVGTAPRLLAPPLIPVGDNELMSLSPPGIISGNHAVFLSPNAELLPSVSTAGMESTSMMPQDAPSGSRPQTEGILRDSNQNFPRETARENTSIPSTTGVPDTGKAARDVFGLQPTIGTQPVTLEDLNIGYNDGETQEVPDSQGGFEVMQPPLGGETQPVSDTQVFDDLVVLPYDTLTASTIPLEDGPQHATYEPLQTEDSLALLQGSLDVFTFTPSDTTMLKALSNHEEHTMDKNVGYVAVDELHQSKTPRESDPSPVPEGPKGQAGKEEGLHTLEPQGGPSHECLSEKLHDGQNEGDELTRSENGNAGNKVSENRDVVSKQDIQAIIGKKVVKKFGRKNYKGDIVDFDCENQWFKVVYEDGDQEDLELEEVKDILVIGDTSSNTSTTKRKRSIAKGGAKQARKQKKHKGEGNMKLKGKVEKKGSKRSKLEASATTFLPAADGTSVSARKKSQYQSSSGAKRKRSSNAEIEPEINSGSKAIKVGKGLSTTAKASRKSSSKKGDQNMEEKEKEEGVAKAKGKRQKLDDTHVGKMVKKDFDGTLYSGTVTKYDKKTKYYKVTYVDGDQEDLELEELKAVLVQ